MQYSVYHPKESDVFNMEFKIWLVSQSSGVGKKFCVCVCVGGGRSAANADECDKTAQ